MEGQKQIHLANIYVYIDVYKCIVQQNMAPRQVPITRYIDASIQMSILRPKTSTQ
jgi:hypothetical protein